MNLLVTGGAGFIGSNLAYKLVDNGNDVIALDIKEKPANLSNCIEDVVYFSGDIRDKEFIKRIITENQIEGIIHLAAISRVIWGEHEPEACVDINIYGTKNLLESIKNYKEKPWVIFGSSREVYGEPNIMPVKETHPKIPMNIYGKTKIVGEKLVEEYSEKYDFKSVILRFSNVYGNEKDIMDRVLPRFVLSALKNDGIEIHGGNQVLDFTHIDDTVNGIIQTIKFLERNANKPDGFQTEDFHILTGEGSTLQQAVEIISHHLECELDINYTEGRNYDVEKFFGDPTKASEMLNYKAEILPKKGIPEMIDRFKEVFEL